MSEQSRVIGFAGIGAVVGAAVGYLFFTERGRSVLERFEPAVEDLRREFYRFQGTVQKLGDMANEGMRVVNEFQTARSQAFSPDSTSH